ncbi:OmpA family protein [Pseudooceanicola aestuarii]|uniref:OmpA family protein n=1 Tax=Pseudooceanicola aestuarii TaxID=2697319 RepID=UPI0013D893E9|nr:OmpA family protein [Pseudooceanicola aestuarii]
MTNTTPRRGRAVAGLAVALALVLPQPGRALDLTLPGRAAPLFTGPRAADSFTLPLAPHDGTQLPSRLVDGEVTRRSWRIGSAMTTLQLMTALKRQVTAAGFDIVLDCQAQDCGGFDFRFAADILSAPDMYVDLFDFRALSALRDGGDGTSAIFLVVSRSSGAGYVQLVHVVPPGSAEGVTTTDGAPAPAPASDRPATGRLDLVARLETRGHAVLRDLDFGVGSAELADSAYASLDTLAGYLRADTGRRVVLVGHTDSLGALDGNIALSRRRAQAVARRLIDRHGVPAVQVSAEGVGYLSPLLGNLSAEGREANRRVEAVLLNTE